MKTKFEVRFKCRCGERHQTLTGSTIKSILKDYTCGKCGSNGLDWEQVTERWVKTSVWYKPSTWDSGYWESAALPKAVVVPSDSNPL